MNGKSRFVRNANILFARISLSVSLPVLLPIASVLIWGPAPMLLAHHVGLAIGSLIVASAFAPPYWRWLIAFACSYVLFLVAFRLLDALLRYID